MSVKLKNGVYHIDAYLPGGERLRQSLKTSDYSEALQQASILLSVNSTSGSHVGKTPTLEIAFNRALVMRPKWRDAKAPETLHELAGHVFKHFGKDRELGTIGDEQVAKWIDGMLKAKLANSSINQRLSLLSVLFKESRLPVPRIPRMTIRQGRIRTITREEQELMCNALVNAKRMETAALVNFLADTAMRLSEALSLRWKDINLADRTATVWENKADHPRTVPLTKGAVLLLGCSNNHGPGPFYTLTKDAAEKHWAKARESIGLADDHQFVIHALRHSCITRLAKAGVDAFRIMTFAGHKRITTTQKYMHLDGSQLRGLADALERQPS
jgi:integrase